MEHHHPKAAASATSSLVPAMDPPLGVVSDLKNHPNPLWEFNIITQTVCMTVAGTLFCLRCYVRLGFSRMPRQWILEDWMVCLSFTGLTVFSALAGLLINNHGGVHQWDLTDDQVRRVLYWFWIETIIYGPCIFFTKLSILLLYLRLLVPTRWSPLWTTIQSFIGISASFYIAITLVKIWQCNPREKAWIRDIPGQCISLSLLFEASGFFNTISDALILLVPVKVCWNLRMSWQKKVGVCAIFTVGAIAPILSAIGFAVRVKAAGSLDITYHNPLILLWATAEVTTGVICACLPTLPSLLRRSGKPSNASRHCPVQPRSDQLFPQNENFAIMYFELDDVQKATRTIREDVTTVKREPSPVDSFGGEG